MVCVRAGDLSVETRTAGTDSPIGSGDLKPEAFPPDAQAFSIGSSEQ
jgi:hypothetical protein